MAAVICNEKKLTDQASRVNIGVQKQFADVIIADVISHATSGSGRWQSIVTFSEF